MHAPKQVQTTLPAQNIDIAHRSHHI